MLNDHSIVKILVTSVTRVASAREAMIASRNEHGHIDPAFIEEA